MRKFKFRAWDGETFTYWNTILNNDWQWGQFTGIIDDNGKEVYEGDLVDIKVVPYYKEYLTYSNQEVKYDEQYGMYVFGNEEFSMADKISEIAVVGNIYEPKTADL
jgi:hypothetical protein